MFRTASACYPCLTNIKNYRQFFKPPLSFHLKRKGLNIQTTEKPTAHLSKPRLQAYLYSLQI
ncbi:MAG: hypothetical protein D8H97_00170 [Neisseria sp.]|nr:MAG: hypothetical protein D8H97_00170 [Neisseria sp.]